MPVMHTLPQDLGYAIRVLRKGPAFLAVAIVTLALGIGATTALFSIIYAVLLKPLPYPDSNRLAQLAEINAWGHPMSVSYPDFDDWRKQNHAFEFVAAYGDGDFSISGGKLAVRAHTAVVTQEFFKVLGGHPELGRGFLPGEHKPNSTASVIISDSLWRALYAADPLVVGRTINLFGGIPFNVIGVMPPGFDYPNGSQLWITAELMNWGLNSRTAHNFRVIGKLEPRANFRQAQEEIGAIARRIKREYPSPYQGKDAQVISMQQHIAGPVKPTLLTLFAAVGLVLLIVCVNVANLLLARSTAKARELAIRGALGADWRRLIRPLLMESLILSVVGGAAGTLLAFWAVRLIKLFIPSNIPRIETAGIDLPVLFFAGLISLLSGLLFSLMPAWSATRTDINEGLKEGSSQHTASYGTRRSGNLLVVSEIALAFMLLIGTGLLVRSFERLNHQGSGFDPKNVLTADLIFPMISTDPKAPPVNYVPDYQTIASAVRRIPGVREAAFSSAVPLDGNGQDGHFSIQGQADLPGMLSDAKYRVISPGYFRAIGATLAGGRFLTESDGQNTTAVVVINAAMAKTVFPRGDAIGHRIWFDSFDLQPQWMTVVGIVNDFREGSLSEPAMPAGYACYTQHLFFLTDMYLVVKTQGDPLHIAPTIRRKIQEINKNVPITFNTLENIFAKSIAHQRFQAEMLGLFAWLAISLAAIGIYGVLSYLVVRPVRRSESACRLAQPPQLSFPSS
jgi:putative ABC transport system permease protein